MTTIKDVAQLADVSIATVSKITNGNDRNISCATREKVNRIMKETNYVPNAVAKGLKVKQTKTIGFILPDISNPFFPEIARGIEDVAWANRFSVTFCNTANNSKREADALSLLQSKMIDGLIVTKSMSGDTVDSLADLKIPVVVVDRKGVIRNGSVGEIFIDAASAFFDITDYLYSSGCRKIAYISASGKYDNARFEGFKNALLHDGLPFENSMVFRSNYDIETGIHGVKKIINSSPDAIVCGNDLIAAGVLGALKEQAISVPDDIKVTGFDDIYFSRLLNPSLTTVKQPAYEMGAEAAIMLIDFIVNSKPLFSKKLEYQLVIRESTSNIHDGGKVR